MEKPDESQSAQTSNEEGSQSHVKQKRGRKMTQPDIYYEESEKNIQKWKSILKSGQTEEGVKLEAVDKQRLRNKISALKSRMSKKTELTGLQGVLVKAKRRFDNLTTMFYEQMEAAQRDSIVQRTKLDLDSDEDDDKDFDVPLENRARSKSRKGGDNKQYFAYRLNQYLGFAK